MASSTSDSRPSNAGVAIRPTAAMQSYATGNGGVAAQYQIVLDVRGDQTLTSGNERLFPIIANLPERYNVNFSSTWDAPFANTNGIEAVGAGLKKVFGIDVKDALSTYGGIAANAMGISTRLKSQSVQVWQNSSPLSFSLDLVFHAKTNSMVDIRDKHIALLKLAAPSQSGPMGEVLIQPGPIITDQVWDQKSRKISLQIGTYLFLDNVIITNVGSDIETICDENGIPLSMTVNIEVASFYASFTTQDIDKMFSGGNGVG